MPNYKGEKISSGKKMQLFFVRYNVILTLATVCLIIALSYFWFLRPKYELIGQGGANDIKFLQEQKLRRQTYLNKLKDVSAKYHKINESEIEKLKKILPTDPEIAGLFIQLQDLAQKNNLLLANVSINETAPADESQANAASPDLDQLKRLSISLNLISRGEGSYEELKKFLTILESNLRVFDVQAVYFTPKSPNYSLSLITYYIGQ